MADNSKKWQATTRKYKTYIKLERRLSANTVESYMHDVEEFARFVVETYDLPPKKVEESIVEQYMASLFDDGRKKSSQARVLSSLKSLFCFLQLSDQIENSPAEFVTSPRLQRALPEVLTTEEIDRIIETFDFETPKGRRDCAIVEMLYSCGLRVSELTTLRISDMFLEDGYIRVIGKGDKQRLVPISSVAIQRIKEYLELRDSGAHNEETLFLNNRHKPLTRVMIFTIIKGATAAAGISKSVSPHTLRHSFATHLIEGGASIRQVQEMLGHESITTTEIYTHLDAKRLRETVSKYLPI